MMYLLLLGSASYNLQIFKSIEISSIIRPGLNQQKSWNEEKKIKKKPKQKKTPRSLLAAEPPSAPGEGACAFPMLIWESQSETWHFREQGDIFKPHFINSLLLSPARGLRSVREECVGAPHILPHRATSDDGSCQQIPWLRSCWLQCCGRKTSLCPISELPSGNRKTEEKAETEQNRQPLGVDLLRQADFPAQPRHSGGGGEFGKLQAAVWSSGISHFYPEGSQTGKREKEEGNWSHVCGPSSDVMLIL